MQEYQRYKGEVTSGILFQFWLLLLLCGVVTCSERIRETKNNVGKIYYYSLFYKIHNKYAKQS